MQLSIYNESEIEPPAADLDPLFHKLMTGENASDWSSQVNLIFCDDSRMQELNSQYRKKDQTTDVLSFNIDDPKEPDSILGEIYISLTVAIKQAKEYEVSLVDEIRRLFVHGLLHLLGYDHQADDDARGMFSTEEKYLGLNGESV